MVSTFRAGYAFAEGFFGRKTPDSDNASVGVPGKHCRMP